jgi:hypothetical protein
MKKKLKIPFPIHSCRINAELALEKVLKGFTNIWWKLAQF